MPWDRFVLGYHGCDRSVLNDVLTGKQDLRVSRNDYDWRGNGIYFWEYSYQRAFQWAHRKAALPAFLTSSIPDTTLYP